MSPFDRTRRTKSVVVEPITATPKFWNEEGEAGRLRERERQREEQRRERERERERQRAQLSKGAEAAWREASQIVGGTKDFKPHHHRFQLQCLGKVAKCHMCPWPIWGLIVKCYHCQECQMTVHEECRDSVLTECPVWVQQSRAQHLLKLTALFPNLGPEVITEAYEWSDCLDHAISKLVLEDQNRQMEAESAVGERQTSLDSNRRSSPWVELRQVDTTIKQFTSRLEEVQAELAALKKDKHGNPEPSQIGALSDEVRCVQNALAALYRKPDHIVRALKSTGAHQYYVAEVGEGGGAQEEPQPEEPSSPEEMHSSLPSRLAHRITSTPPRHSSTPSPQPEELSLEYPSPPLSPRRSAASFSIPEPQGAAFRKSSAPLPLPAVQEPEKKVLARELFPNSVILHKTSLTVSPKILVHPQGNLSQAELNKGPQVHPYKVVTHHEKLLEETQKRKSTIYDLRVKMEKLRQQLKDDIQLFREQSLRPLLKPRRELYVMEHFALEAKIEFEDACLESIQKRADYILTVLDKLSDGDMSVSASLLHSSRRYLAVDPQVRFRRLFVLYFERRAQEKLQAFNEAKRKEGQFSSVLQRRQKLQELLAVTANDENCPYPISNADLALLADILTDSRTLYGRWIRNAIDSISSDPQCIVGQILAFLTEFTESLGQEHRLSDLWFLRARLDCIFFSSLHLKFTRELDTPALEEQDALIQKAGPPLRLRSPAELGLSTKFLGETVQDSLSSFSPACEILSDLPFLLAPVEMLMCLASSVEKICLIAEGMLGPSRTTGLAADDILPIMIFCVIHTDLYRPVLLLRFMEEFGDDLFKRGRLGYCLTTYEAALLDVLNNLGPEALQKAV